MRLSPQGHPVRADLRALQLGRDRARRLPRVSRAVHPHGQVGGHHAGRDEGLRGPLRGEGHAAERGGVHRAPQHRQSRHTPGEGDGNCL